MDKYLRSRLIFDLSAKVADGGLPSVYLNIFVLVGIISVEFKFYM